MNFWKTIAVAAIAGATLCLPARAEDRINAVHFTPTQVGFAQSFLRFVDKVNERGKGIVQIDVRGGPEVIPNTQLGAAQQSGLIDMINNPAGLYLEIVPEGDAFSAATVTPWEARENGGWDAIDQIYQEKGNAKLLAWVDTGVGFHIWTVDEPKLQPDGMLDFNGLVLRASPLYKQFFDSIGAQAVVMPMGDTYTALERGMINGLAYPSIGYKAFGWDKFTRYRVDPGFFGMDVLISMNLDAWNDLTDESKALLTEVAQEFERESSDAIRKEDEETRALLEQEGMQVVEMTGEGRQKFLDAAAKSSWDRMTARDPAHVDQLRDLFN
ncbi:C4-dicarboxylate ABC transporter substrate-binding protein [Paracoccus aurantiacus]|uniref:C4-dicarboxylate ABC transporter substrate-binding protein n=1 Tax=Paracoccus aurantiacus TaxID=2599412 RepID=A0A5C6S142_9RHOB|nr:TRAP transporter substrate-binding protein DctP [Paracoccus aurantiacus]TXB67729.1 C4-dicarboxylate ABC transporter substrate-binding protein [Paracoccus aurantiacus]